MRRVTDSRSVSSLCIKDPGCIQQDGPGDQALQVPLKPSLQRWFGLQKHRSFGTDCWRPKPRWWIQCSKSNCWPEPQWGRLRPRDRWSHHQRKSGFPAPSQAARAASSFTWPQKLKANYSYQRDQVDMYVYVPSSANRDVTLHGKTRIFLTKSSFPKRWPSGWIFGFAFTGTTSRMDNVPSMS